MGETRIERKPLCPASPPGKHSILWEIRVQSEGCSCLPELVSTARCNKPAWSEILFALAPLCLREKRGCARGKSLKERDTSFTGLPRSICGRCSTLPREKSRSRWPSGLETVVKQESQPWQTQRPVAIQVSTASCAETEAWLLRRQEEMRMAGRVLHS